MSGRVRVVSPWSDREEDIRKRLRNYRALVSKHQACQEMYDQLFPGQTQRFSDEPRGGQIEMFAIESVVDQRMLLSKQLTRSLHEIQMELVAILALIKDLPSIEYTIIVRRYQMGETWEQIGANLGYCREQAIRIHNKAIVRLSEKMPRHVT